MKQAWKYGEAGDKWQVQSGDVWASEDHRYVLGCSDIERVDIALLYAMSGIPSLIYCDPPWNVGNIKSFRTKAGLDSEGVDFERFLVRLLNIAKSSGMAYIEMGEKHTDILEDKIRASSGQVAGKWNCTYYRTKPLVIVCASWDGRSPRTDLEGKDDEHTPLEVITNEVNKDGLVGDFCTGRGLTCRSAFAAGRRFVGTELNARRLAVLIDWLDKQGVKMVQYSGKLG